MRNGRMSTVRLHILNNYLPLILFEGDLIYIYVFGNPILVLNSAEAVTDLLEKRSGNYSSRPVRTMVVEL